MKGGKMEFDMEKLRNNNNPLLRRVSRQMDNKRKENSLKVSSNVKNSFSNGFNLLDNEEPEEPIFEAPVQKTKLELFMGRNLGRGGRK
jgi:hypothetical protein